MSQRTCPQCGAGKESLSIRKGFVSAPIGDFSLAGSQMKFSATEVLLIECDQCNWGAEGHFEGRHFVVKQKEGVAERGGGKT